MEFTNPEGVAAPASRYSQLVTVPANARRAIASGQIGVAPDGSLKSGLEAQMEQAFENLFNVFAAAGMKKTDIVKIVFYSTVPGSVATFRAMRDRVFEGHAPACTYLEISQLATPEMLCEVEGEAVAL
ncbi:MAG: RidA family protein [Nisaea sp.]|jgi:enamine deaminase RidA (YjgF/YER057c/UK114 family)|uniref:RidA family protein n=1 Tax=Nisaea sp. TaxID=2024842 RepID=UPI001B20F0B4|nr:RidA family protein [Nisaea sp.]MBO6562117.1 RidA family protein [Nisaea sp.]